MAVFRIGPNNSLFGVSSVFGGVVPSSNTLIFDPGGFLISTFPGATAATLNPVGAWTVTINGSVLSTGGTGISLFGLPTDFSPTVPPRSTITIGKEGTVEGAAIGISLSRPATLNNAGLILATSPIGSAIALIGQSADTVINTGTIAGDVFRAGTGATTISNSGFIDGTVALDTGSDVVSNRGAISQLLALGEGNNKLTNSGSILTLTSGNGSDTITNTGSIAFGGSATSLGDGNNKLTNSGAFARIGGTLSFGAGNDGLSNSGKTAAAVFMGAGNDTVSNSGTMEFGVNLGSGVNKLTNSGTIKGSFIGMGDEADTVSNTGSIEVDIVLGGGSNVVTNSKKITGDIIGGANTDRVTNNGSIFGDVILGDGNDIYSGTGTFFRVIDGGGNDTYTFGTKGGTFQAVGVNSDVGTDTVTGGTSLNDTYSLQGATTVATNVVNMAGSSRGVSDFQGVRGTEFAATSATGADIGIDIVKSMESVIGSNQNDIIFGTNSANRFDGNDGQDLFMAFGGADLIYGGGGSDLIIGGTGGDILAGNDGNSGDGAVDVFRYFAISESGVSATTRDVIYDFEDGLDRIELDRIDANSALAGDQAFRFIGSNVNWDLSGAGQLRSRWTAFGQVLEADVNGDRKADFSIAIYDVPRSVTIDASDFIL